MRLLPVLEERQNDGWRVIVLTADWCGDALLCVPVMKRISEVANIEMSLLIRDENLEINGSIFNKWNSTCDSNLYFH